MLELEKYSVITELACQNFPLYLQQNFVLNGQKCIFHYKMERMEIEPLADGKEQFQP